MGRVDEAKLLPRIQALDREALAEMYDAYSDRLYGYAFRLLNNRQLAEDCVSETFTRLLAALQSGNGPQSSLQAYLYRIAHNWITDIYRRQPLEPLTVDETIPMVGDKIESEVELRAANAQILQAMRRLTPDQRQVIILKYVEDWTNEQIAQALQKPVGAVKSLQHRGLESLRRMLQQV